jgi:outer membrane protein OmpA-like peptidoglycan-associated protein
MRHIHPGSKALILLSMLAVPAWSSVAAQEQEANERANIIVNAPRYIAGPDVKGVITARNDQKLKVTMADGSTTVIAFNELTRIKSGGGFLSGGKKLGPDALLNGLPVTVKTWQADDGLLANQITFKAADLKTAMMIRNGTAQQFAEQTAATNALRSRVADIDNYNIKGTTNVYFDTGKWVLSERGKADLCAAATQADSMSNALLLVIGYTDSVGNEDYNQELSEKRASRVINYLQQACGWKPYRVLTPTGMAESDPAASNDTEEGRAQNRRVAVNILVSKSVDGL